MEANLALPSYYLEPSRLSLYRYGNVSSASIWYELELVTEHGNMCGKERGEEGALPPYPNPNPHPNSDPNLAPSPKPNPNPNLNQARCRRPARSGGCAREIASGSSPSARASSATPPSGRPCATSEPLPSAPPAAARSRSAAALQPPCSRPAAALQPPCSRPAAALQPPCAALQCRGRLVCSRLRHRGRRPVGDDPRPTGSAALGPAACGGPGGPVRVAGSDALSVVSDLLQYHGSSAAPAVRVSKDR